ncbi:MAG: ribosomal protein S18-alanine N-acetyltransferase [Roseburia sp.]|nr:ribosomal protein S18-alanine N-acetyltransferase [Roseburia sp.]
MRRDRSKGYRSAIYTQSAARARRRRPVMKIRRARASDAPTVARAEARYIDCPWSEEQIAAEINNDRAIFLVAEADGAPIGYISGCIAADECEIANIAVEERYRRRGVGSALFSELMRQAAARGTTAVFLTVRTDNAGAIALYKSLGFEQVGERIGYYGGKDAYIMRRDIDT